MEPLKRILRPIYAPLLRRYRRSANLREEQRRIREAVLRARRAGEPVKVIIGAGNTQFAGWIASDIPAFDVLDREHWAFFFPPKSIDRMLAEHVFEHLSLAHMGEFLNLARIYLTAEGRVRIAVPDGYHPDPDYVERVRPGGSGYFADDHKVLYTCDLIGDLLEEHGYQYCLLEYFDDAGQFHKHEWHAADGFVGRSAEHDERNAAGQLKFTSLIVDCWL